MPRSSIADAIVGWEKAVANAKANATDVPGMEAYLAPLEKILTDAKDLSARLDMRKGVKQQETRDRRALIQAGNVQVSRIRSAIKAFYGPNSERVIEFGARPLRPRTNKVKQAKVEPPAVSQPGTSGPPSPPAAAPNEKDEAPRNPITAKQQVVLTGGVRQHAPVFSGSRSMIPQLPSSGPSTHEQDRLNDFGEALARRAVELFDN